MSPEMQLDDDDAVLRGSKASSMGKMGDLGDFAMVAARARCYQAAEDVAEMPAHAAYEPRAP